VKLTKEDLLDAYAKGRDRGQAEGRAARMQLDTERMSLATRNAELEALVKDISRDLVNANRNAYQYIAEQIAEVLAELPEKELPPSGGVADGMKSEPTSDHGPARAATIVEVVLDPPWVDPKS
jgi:hypothetical protein